MVKTYKKPETKTIKVELQQMIAESLQNKGEYNGGVNLGAKGSSFDFFEEEEVPTKSDSDDSWEDWEEEEDY